jgi:xanthine dehydrogenase accessory factor
MKAAHLDALLAAQKTKRPIVLVTRIDGGAQAIVTDDTATGALVLTPALRQMIDKALLQDRSMTVEADGARYFLQVQIPPRRLIVVGAVHIAQSLVPMAAIAGYAVIVVDPRGAFATDARFPGVTLSTEWPDDALTALDPDRRTAIVTLTHDPKLDDPALSVALRSEAFYIGALGSKRTHARRVDRLREAGFNDKEIARIHAPIGLDIGAVSPAEISLSILGQITEVLHTPAAEKAA